MNDLVTVPDANSLDLTTGVTLEAWVRPSTVTGWRTALLKEQTNGLVYAIYANTDANRPSGHLFTTVGVRHPGHGAAGREHLDATWR